MAANTQGATTGQASTLAAGPAVTGVNPAAGPASGGTAVTITGSGFTGASSVTFGGTPAAYTTFSDTQIIAFAPAHAPGQTLVKVAGPAGASSQNVFYTYLATPTITSLTPTAGPAAGGNGVTITGTDLGFTGAVTFGGTRAAFTVLSNTQIVAVAPAGTGTVVVAVTTPGGTSVGSAYTYVPAPMI